MEIDDTVCSGAGDEYFHSYEDLEVHKLMLTDTPRNKAYKEAIFANKDFISGKTVLDVGAGTGILSIFCAQAGAKQVYAVEASNTYQIAEEVIKENKFEHTITVIHGRVEDLTDNQIPEKVDVIVSEWMGFYLFHEGMLNSVIVARDKFLKNDGKMFPESATLYSCPCSVPSDFEEWDNVEGVKMGAFAKKLRETLDKPLIQVVKPEHLLSDPEIVTWLDLKEVTAEDIKQFSIRHVAVCNKAGNYQGISLWFTCMFPFSQSRNNVEPVTLSTEPDSPATHWKQTVVLLPNSLNNVEVGMPVSYDLALSQLCDNNSNGRRYSLEVTMLDAMEVEHPEFCMCYMTKCILVRAMLERYEKGDSENIHE